MAWVAGARRKSTYYFQDRVGRVATVDVWVGGGEDDPEGGSVSTLRAAFLACTDAAIKATQILAYAKQDTTPAYGTDAFDRPTDKLEVGAITAEGIPVTMKLPSLLAANYQADGVTPLTTGAAAALMTAILENCVSADGEPLTKIKRARRMIPSGLKSWTRKA